MSNRVPQGKGSGDRTRNRDAYNANFDSIRWPSRQERSAAATRTQPGSQPKQQATVNKHPHPVAST